MVFYQLEIGWSRFQFPTAAEAAAAMDMLTSVPYVDTVWSEQGTIYFHKDCTLTITRVVTPEVLPNIEAANERAATCKREASRDAAPECDDA